MLSTKQIACRRNGRTLFHAIDLEVDRGDALRVAGHNGSGKTSLLRLLCGLSAPAQGEIYWQQQPIRHLREAYWRELIYVGHLHALKDDLSAWENLAMAARLSGLALDRSDALRALARMGIATVADKPVRMLSQGQRKRVSLARLCIGAPAPLWILDEPAVSLDKDAVATLCSVLDEHVAQGGIVVYATHQALPIGAGRSRHIDLEQCVPC